MMRAGPVGLAIVLIAGLVYFAWPATDPERRAEASEAPTKQRIASEQPSAQTPAAVSPVSTSHQSELTNRLHATYLRQQCRDQPRNREAALERLLELIRQATMVPKRRKPTKATYSSKVKRLESKTKRSGVKAARGKPKID